jgi:hypothetical protein
MTSAEEHLTSGTELGCGRTVLEFVAHRNNGDTRERTSAIRELGRAVTSAVFKHMHDAI